MGILPGIREYLIAYVLSQPCDPLSNLFAETLWHLEDAPNVQVSHQLTPSCVM